LITFRLWILPLRSHHPGRYPTCTGSLSCSQTWLNLYLWGRRLKQRCLTCRLPPKIRNRGLVTLATGLFQEDCAPTACLPHPLSYGNDVHILWQPFQGHFYILAYLLTHPLKFRVGASWVPKWFRSCTVRPISPLKHTSHVLMISVHKQSLAHKLIGKIDLRTQLQGSPLLLLLVRQVRQLVVRSPSPIRFQLLRYNSPTHSRMHPPLGIFSIDAFIRGSQKARTTPVCWNTPRLHPRCSLDMYISLFSSLPQIALHP
jgi:hypothetical protein